VAHDGVASHRECIVIRARSLTAFAWLLHAGAAAAIEVGQAAADFSYQDIHGTTHTLSALRGKAVLLAFIGYG
jgi:hypothetical protein